MLLAATDKTGKRAAMHRNRVEVRVLERLPFVAWWRFP